MYEELAKSLRTTVMLYVAVGQEDLITTQLMKQAADAIEELKQLAEVIPHKCKCCIGCELEKKNGGCDSFVLSLERSKAYIEENLDWWRKFRALMDAAGTPIQEDSPLTELTKFSWRECGDNQPMSKDTVYCCPNPVCGKRRMFEWQLTNYCPDCGLRLFKPVPQTKDGGQDE